MPSPLKHFIFIFFFIVEGSLLKVEEALQSSKIECRGRWRRERLEQSLETSAVAGGVDQ